MAPGPPSAPVRPKRGDAHPGPAQLTLPLSQPLPQSLVLSFQVCWMLWVPPSRPFFTNRPPLSPSEGPGARMGPQWWAQQVAVHRVLVHHLTSPGCRREGGGTGPVVPVCPQVFPAEEVLGVPCQSPTCPPWPMIVRDILSPSLPRSRWPVGNRILPARCVGGRGRGWVGPQTPQGRACLARAPQGDARGICLLDGVHSTFDLAVTMGPCQGTWPHPHNFLRIIRSGARVISPSPSLMLPPMCVCCSHFPSEPPVISWTIGQ